MVGVIAENSGRITSVTVLGPPFAGTPVGQCIQRAVGLASFPPFARPTFSVQFPLRPALTESRIHSTSVSRDTFP